MKQTLTHTANKMNNKKTGYIMLTVVVIFLMISLGAALSLAGIVYRESAMSHSNVRSLQSVYASESLQEDIFYRFVSGKQVPSIATLSLNGANAEATVEDLSGSKRVTSVGDAENKIRKTEMKLDTGGGAAFHYGVQAGQGGFEIGGSSHVVGNLYSNGPIKGSWSGVIEGDVVSAGPSGLVDNITTTGSVYAHRIQNSTQKRIAGDVYYQSIFNVNPKGAMHPNSPDMPVVGLPLLDSAIEDWEAAAEAGGTISGPCPYKIGGVDVKTLGPVKIECDLKIGGSSKVTFAGPVWVTGNIDIGGGGTVKIDESLGSQSVPIIADNPSNRTTSSMIDIGGGVPLTGGDNFFLFISQNNSSELGGSKVAIDMGGGTYADSLILYAGHGKVKVGGSAKLSAITAHNIDLSGAVKITYKSGLANLIFSSGPSGGYVLKSLEEIQ